MSGPLALAQGVFLKSTGRRLQYVAELHGLWALEMSQPSSTEGDDLIFGRGRIRLTIIAGHDGVAAHDHLTHGLTVGRNISHGVIDHTQLPSRRMRHALARAS